MPQNDKDMQQHQYMAMFETGVNKNEKLKQNQIKACRENFYLKKIAILLSCFALYGLVVWIFLDPMFSIMPILSANACFY